MNSDLNTSPKNLNFGIDPQPDPPNPFTHKPPAETPPKKERRQND
jgi:hypothetical protein